MNDQTPNGASEPKKPGRFRRLLRFSFLGLVAAVAAYLIVVPLAQPLLVAAWRWMPVIVFSALSVTAIAVIVRRSAANPQRRKRALWVGMPLTLLVAGVLVHNNLAQWVVDHQLATYVSRRSADIKELPRTVDNRILPRSTAREYAKNSNVDNRMQVGRPHLVLAPAGADGERELYWQAPLEYQVWYGRVFGSSDGVVRVEASQPDMHTDKSAGEGAFFLFSDQSWVTKALFRLRHPFSEASEVVYWRKDDGSWSILISYVSYRPTWTGTMIPVMNGVMEIGPYGGFRNYSPEEAKEQFDGAALFPPELARRYAEAYANYHLGIFNHLVVQEQLLEVSEDASRLDPTERYNRYPYFQQFEGLGLQLMVPFEPKGPSSYALSKVLFFDGITGEVRHYGAETAQLNGPRKSLLNVQNADPNSDWAQYDSVEPRLVHGQRGTYWLVTVIRNDGVSNAFVMMVLIDARTLKAYRFEKAEDLKRFLSDSGAPGR